MTLTAAVLLAALSVWEYPGRHHRHEQLRDQFVAAAKEGDTETMVETCEKGVLLLPDDPTWRYNLACALAYTKDHPKALDTLEEAIDLGFRDADAILGDSDLKRLVGEPRFKELVEYAKDMARRPLTRGPNAHVPQTAVAGGTVALGEQNFHWDFEYGLLVADLKLAPGPGANAGDLYMNRDHGHSHLNQQNFPGLTVVRLDQEGRATNIDLNEPNMIFPYPTFGNASRAFGDVKFWRSLPRFMMTEQAWRMKSLVKLYRSNQLWFFPAHQDCPPVGKFGDVFASICPYFWVSAGSSYTDQPFLGAALEASRTLPRETKQAMVEQGMLAPSIMTLMRQSLRNVTNETAYLSAAAHPTAFPAGSIDINRLKAAAAKMKPSEIPPLVAVSVIGAPVKERSVWQEITYATAFATAFVLRSPDEIRQFRLVGRGAEECEIVLLRGENAAKLRKSPMKGIADLEIDRTKMSVTSRVDVAVFGRNPGTGWGAPSYVSFAVVDPDAPYSDPLLTPLKDVKSEP